MNVPYFFMIAAKEPLSISSRTMCSSSEVLTTSTYCTMFGCRSFFKRRISDSIGTSLGANGGIGSRWGKVKWCIASR